MAGRQAGRQEARTGEFAALTVLQGVLTIALSKKEVEKKEGGAVSRCSQPGTSCPLWGLE